MALQVCMGATLKCSFGTTPSSLVVLPRGSLITAGGPLAANIMDHMPMVNIMPFGLCNTVTNPAVASATSAALGVLTPMPCIPVTTTPWVPGSPTVPLNNAPALNNTSTCLCTWLGVISIINAGQTIVSIP